jgi:cation diffusion facilitator family transporter
MKREQKIIRASWWAILGNALLAFLKLGAGFISGSYAVIADGIDSVSDIISSVVVLVAARIISRPPNVKFPYGYKKADTIAAKVLSFVIFFAGAQLAYSTITILISGSTIETPGKLAIWVTLISIAGKLILSLFLFRTGKNVDSPMLIANARNMRNDILLSLSVLASLLFTVILQQPLIDRIIAILISLFIM